MGTNPTAQLVIGGVTVRLEERKPQSTTIGQKPHTSPVRLSERIILLDNQN